MPRPAEYENLIKIKAFEEVLPTTGAVKGFLDNAKNYLEACELLTEEKTLQIFTMAYEGYFQIVQAILEQRGVEVDRADIGGAGQVFKPGAARHAEGKFTSPGQVLRQGGLREVNALPDFADRRLQRDRLLRHLHDLLHALDGQVHLVGDLLGRLRRDLSRRGQGLHGGWHRHRRGR